MFLRSFAIYLWSLQLAPNPCLTRFILEHQVSNGLFFPSTKISILYGHHAVTWLINLIVYFWTKRKSGGAARGWGPQLRRFICRTLRAHTKLQATHVIISSILKQILWCLIFCNEIERSKYNMKRKRFLFFLTIKEPITLPSRVTANTLSAWEVITSNRLVKSVRNVNCTIHKCSTIRKIS